VVVCTSPKAGSGRTPHKIPQLIERLRGRGCNVIHSNDLGEIARCVEQSGPAELRAVVPAGGDGTISLIADRLPVGTPLVPFPMGTENLLARHFGYTSDPVAAAETILHGTIRRFDAGRANGKLFLVMATCGFDAEVVRGMHLTRRGHIARWSYFKPIARAVRKYKYPAVYLSSQPPPESPMTMALADRSESGSSLGVAGEEYRWVMFFNLPCYGGGLSIQPTACGDDARLDLVGLRYGSSLSTVRYVVGAWLKQHLRWKDIVQRTGREWYVWSDARVSYQLDGDYAGRLPLQVECLPERLTLRMPTTQP